MLGLAPFLLGLLLIQPPEPNASGPEVEVQSVQSTQAVHGVWLELSPTALSIQSENPTQSIALTDLQSVGFARPSAASVAPQLSLLLHDGTQIAPISIVTDGPDIRAELSEGVSIKLSPLLVKAIQLQPLTETQQTQWQAILDSRITADTLVLVRSPESLDKIEGSIGPIGDESIAFTFNDQNLNAPRVKLAGLRFFSPPAKAQSVVAIVTDILGNVWNAAELVSARGSNQLDLTLAGGGKVALPLDVIQSLDFSVGSTLYVAELSPTRQGRLSSSDLTLDVGGTDSLFAPQPVLLPKTSGPSLRFFGNSWIAYRVPDDYSRLIGTVYLAPTGDHFTPCTVRVKLENDVLWEQKLERLNQRVDLSLTVEAGKRIRFEVVPQDRPAAGDVVVWRELRLLK